MTFYFANLPNDKIDAVIKLLLPSIDHTSKHRHQLSCPDVKTALLRNS